MAQVLIDHNPQEPYSRLRDAVAKEYKEDDEKRPAFKPEVNPRRYSQII